jgi:hypothetical protein
MTDLFHDWHSQRFVVAPVQVEEWGHWYVVLSDIHYWNHHWEDLQSWCQNYACRQQGMVLDFDSEQALTAFILRWS